MGLEDIGKAETLRRLRAPQPRTVERRGDTLAGPRLLERVGEGQRGNCTRRLRERRQHAVDDIARDERAGGIMDQRQVWQVSRKRPEAVCDRDLAGGAPTDRAEQLAGLEASDRGPVERLVAPRDDNRDKADIGVIKESAQGTRKDWDAANADVLLGQWPANPRAAAGGEDQRGGLQAGASKSNPALP